MLKKILPFLIGSIIVGCGSSEENNDSNIDSGNNTPIIENGEKLLKKLLITNNTTPVTIYAQMDVEDKYIEHAANILSGYLDNNNDGNWDNLAVTNELEDEEAVLFLAKTEDSADLDFVMSLPEEYREILMSDSSQILYENEMIICSDDYQNCFSDSGDGRDASYEEILHLITHVGYSEELPLIFSEEYSDASVIAVSMDLARNDTARELERPHPINGWEYTNDAWYKYTDRTCDYDCMVTEYTYWTIFSALGGMEHLKDISMYSEEYKCLSTTEFKTGGTCEHDTGIVSLYGAGAHIRSDNKLDPNLNPYNLPTQLPVGDYKINGTHTPWNIEFVYD